jgi:hypothetical protein
MSSALWLNGKWKKKQSQIPIHRKQITKQTLGPGILPQAKNGLIYFIPYLFLFAFRYFVMR